MPSLPGSVSVFGFSWVIYNLVYLLSLVLVIFQLFFGLRRCFQAEIFGLFFDKSFGFGYRVEELRFSNRVPVFKSSTSWCC